MGSLSVIPEVDENLFYLNRIPYILFHFWGFWQFLIYLKFYVIGRLQLLKELSNFPIRKLLLCNYNWIYCWNFYSIFIIVSQLIIQSVLKIKLNIHFKNLSKINCFKWKANFQEFYSQNSSDTQIQFLRLNTWKTLYPQEFIFANLLWFCYKTTFDFWTT